MIRYIFAVLSLLFTLHAGAETIPATNQTIRIDWNEWKTNRTGENVYPTAQAACNAAAVTYTNPGAYTEPYWLNGTCYGKSPVNGQFYAMASASGVSTCPAGMARACFSGYCNCTGLSCPSGQNWTFNPGPNTCTRPDCAAGETRNPLTGICEAPACPGELTRQANGQCGCNAPLVPSAGDKCVCPGMQQFSGGTCVCPTSRPDLKGIPLSGKGDIPSAVCFDGCMASLGGFAVGAGGSWAGEYGKPTGQTCSNQDNTPTEQPKKKTPTEDNRTPDQKCLAAGQGFITTSNGTVCTSPGDSPQPLKTKKREEESKTNPGNPGADTTTERVTECQGSQCTTTETVRDANGNIVSSGTKTGTKGAGGDGNGNGNGETDCDKYPDSVGCAKFGAPEEGAPLGEKPVGLSSITPVGVASAATCPAPLQLPKGMTFSFTPFCDFASGLRPVILALAWLSAGFLIFGFKQS